MKAIHYIASTVSFYRSLIDGKQVTWDEGLEQLNRLPNRGYSRGFMKGNVDGSDYSQQRSGSQGESLMVGDVLEETVDGCAVMRVRNKIHAGEELEVLSPDGTTRLYTLEAPLRAVGGQALDFMNNTQKLSLAEPLPPFSIVRRLEIGQSM
jgi:U32 family peptidase